METFSRLNNVPQTENTTFPLLSDSATPSNDHSCRHQRTTIPRKPLPEAFSDHQPTPTSSRTASIQASDSSSILTEIQSVLRLKKSQPTQTGKVIQWGVDWHSPVFMLSLMTIGIMGMLTHHIYNNSLDGNLVDDPQWPQRFGTALAVFSKMCLVASIEIAYVQLVWLRIKKRDYKIKTLDVLFSVCYDPKSFLNSELILHAKVPAILATLVWIIPLGAVVSPASLTSISGLRSDNQTCKIPTLDFQLENGYNADNMNSPGQASALFSLDPNDNLTFYYNSPSRDLDRYFKLAALSDSGFLQLPNPCGIANCSYTYSFIGPSYDCQERAEFANSTWLNKSMLIPDGNWLYLSTSHSLEDPYGRPEAWQDMTSDNETDIGTFFEEPSLWLGYVVNTTEPLVVEPSAAWHYRMESHIFECILYNSTYEYTISFINGDMHIDNSTVHLIDPLLPPGFAMPPTNPNYEAFSAYHAVGFQYRKALSGNVSQTADHGINDYAISNSDIQQISGLLDPDTQDPPPDFPSRVEKQFANIILSLAANPNLYAQTELAGPCTCSTIVLKWKYKPFWLALTYLLAAFATITAVATGLYAFRENGYCADASFSTFLTTTRNPTLDRISDGCCLGQANLPEEFMCQRLRFGQVNRTGIFGAEEDSSHIAFGLCGETSDIVFGRKYL